MRLCVQDARVFGLLFSVIDDVDPSNFAWMPAHTRPEHVGVLRLINGELLSHIDRMANDVADLHAKTAAKSIRVDAAIQSAHFDHLGLVHEAAVWIATATHLANSQVTVPHRDTQASRKAAATHSRTKADTRRARAA